MASKRGIRRYECERKVKFPSANDALHAAKRMGYLTTDHFHYYHCHWCRQYHVGHVPYAVKQAMAARR